MSLFDFLSLLDFFFFFLFFSELEELPSPPESEGDEDESEGGGVRFLRFLSCFSSFLPSLLSMKAQLQKEHVTFQSQHLIQWELFLVPAQGGQRVPLLLPPSQISPAQPQADTSFHAQVC